MRYQIHFVGKYETQVSCLFIHRCILQKSRSIREYVVRSQLKSIFIQASNFGKNSGLQIVETVAALAL